MKTPLWQTIVALLAPFLVFVIVGMLMSRVTGRQAALAAAHPPDPEPLNTRLSYTADDAAAFWGALGRSGDEAEQRFLEFDLVFPTLYGGSLAFSLVWLSRRAHWRPHFAVALASVGVVSDWTENLVQLEQLHRYMATGAAALQSDAVRIASLATATKLGTLGAAYLLLLVLALVIRQQHAATRKVAHR